MQDKKLEVACKQKLLQPQITVLTLMHLKLAKEKADFPKAKYMSFNRLEIFLKIEKDCYLTTRLKKIARGL